MKTIFFLQILFWDSKAALSQKSIKWLSFTKKTTRLIFKNFQFKSSGFLETCYWLSNQGSLYYQPKHCKGWSSKCQLCPHHAAPWVSPSQKSYWKVHAAVACSNLSRGRRCWLAGMAPIGGHGEMAPGGEFCCFPFFLGFWEGRANTGWMDMPPFFFERKETSFFFMFKVDDLENFGASKCLTLHFRIGGNNIPQLCLSFSHLLLRYLLDPARMPGYNQFLILLMEEIRLTTWDVQKFVCTYLNQLHIDWCRISSIFGRSFADQQKEPIIFSPWHPWNQLPTYISFCGQKNWPRQTSKNHVGFPSSELATGAQPPQIAEVAGHLLIYSFLYLFIHLFISLFIYIRKWLFLDHLLVI